MDGEQPHKKRGEGSDAEEAEKTQLDYAEVFSALSYWYHLPYSEIRQMPHTAIEGYMENLERNHARLRMMLGEAAKVPHMKDEDRYAWAEDIQEKLENYKPQPPKIAPLAVLKIIGIGIRK